MSRRDRLALIRRIEELRDSRLLVAVWGDRPNLPTVIAPDVQPVIFEHLERMGKVPKIDVLLYTTGGQTLAAWGLANMMREYCDELGVLIPHRALSAGTLLTLAADEIIMSRAGQLSPIDPSVASALGPVIQTPNQPGMPQVVPISVEDVIGFLDLATKQAGLKEERSILGVFDRLSAQVHPLALGAVYRSREQIVALATRLLSFHMKGEEQSEERDRIVNRLTRELGSHDYLIGRTEARDFLKLPVVDVPGEVEQAMLQLFEEYSSLLELRVAYNPDGFLGEDERKVGNFNRAIIESDELTHVFRTTQEVQRVQVQAAQPGVPFPVLTTVFQGRTLFEGWISDQNI